MAKMMKAIEITTPGGPEVLVAGERSVPVPAAGEVLIAIHAAGVNGPDLKQRQGLYNPPPGATDIPGLEVAGEVVALGEGASRFKVGDKVMALVQGGGYAEFVAASELVTAPVPAGLSMAEAAALPETFMTVWFNLFMRGELKAGESLLIHGGTSGIGSTATMLAKAIGAGPIITTVGSEHHRQASLKLGADMAINYREQDFANEVPEFTGGKGVDVVLDIIGGDYVAKNYKVAAMDGRIVQVSLLQGAAKELNLWPMLAKRLKHMGSLLRPQSPEQKAAILADLLAKAGHLIGEGKVKPQVYETFALDDASQAHRLMESSVHVGKVVLINSAN
ncbi:MAG: NAD(P)H-quinone oxidoreductase [Pseudomonadota bacterium]|nr:NAD(P)H-quinone oxidoreductase [Pseudomonadota bacterium]